MNFMMQLMKGDGILKHHSLQLTAPPLEGTDGKKFALISFPRLEGLDRLLFGLDLRLLEQEMASGLPSSLHTPGSARHKCAVIRENLREFKNGELLQLVIYIHLCTEERCATRYWLFVANNVGNQKCFFPCRSVHHMWTRTPITITQYEFTQMHYGTPNRKPLTET